MTQQSTTSSDELAHYGVKGMKWGARKARTGDLTTRTKRLDRVASGKSSVADKVVTLGGSSAFRLVKSKGLKNEAARRSSNYKAEIHRLSTGKAKAKDLLKAYGSANIVGIARSIKD